jgi:hypothetical protein
MSDPLVALISRLRAAPPPVAVLVGSGASSPSGIITGQDLLLSIAADRGEQPGDDPVGWYIRTFGVFPNYIRMLQQAGGMVDELALPCSYFETADGRPITPSPAHRAIAAMAAAGLAGPILTPNFDRLLEQALLDAGVRFRAAYTLRAITRALGAVSHAAEDELLLVKLHGDYQDISIRDTSCGFATYHPAIDALLEAVLSQFDLLVCGWSASWDIPLRRAAERWADPTRLLTFWLLRGHATPEASRVIVARQAHVIPVTSSSAGLMALACSLRLPTDGRGRW